MAVIDTHCHLDLIAQRGINQQEALAAAQKDGVTALVQIATDLNSSRENASMVKNRNGDGFFDRTQQQVLQLYWTAGLHPCSASEEMDSLDDLFALIRANQSRDDFVAIGETGLDYYHNGDQDDFQDLILPRQKESFAKHLSLAKELGLPIVLHTRDENRYNPEKTQAIRDALVMVRQYQVQGILHCFTYTHLEALPFVELGWFVSYSGALTFSNAKAIQNGATKLPLDCLLVETDAPFLAPVPHRGKVNQPAYVVHTLDFLANLRSRECGEDPQYIKQTIFENSQRFLQLKRCA